jgi:dGTPase
MLAAYAVRVENSGGRRYPEPEHPYRSAFQRDRDRIIHARAFRRLEDKTQVFTLRVSDHFRTRLTHTIEVAQISRTIASRLKLNADLVEALALVHDIGHPPFGHAGEIALDAVMQRHGERFDHNLHALRIVESFERRYIDFAGLNLTFEVREGIIKHSRDYDAKQYPELAEYLLHLRPPLEAQLIDLADEIAYNTADLDDGFEARLLGIDEILKGVGIFARFYREIERRYPQASAKLKFNEALKRMLDRFVTNLIETTAERVSKAGIRVLDDVRNWPERFVAFSPEVDCERREAKEFLYQKLYDSPTLKPQKVDAQQIVTALFDHWLMHPDELPRSYQEKARSAPLTRTICDYIAGMTDNFILQQHRKLVLRQDAPPPSSVTG